MECCRHQIFLRSALHVCNDIVFFAADTMLLFWRGVRPHGRRILRLESNVMLLGMQTRFPPVSIQKAAKCYGIKTRRHR